MKVFIYTALQCQSTHEPLIGGHITTSFTEANRKLPKIYPSGLKTKGFIMGVEYWPEAKVTVALVSAAGLDELHQRLRNAGLDYPYEFKPHVTIAYGEDKTSEYQYLIGELIGISGDYIGTVIKSDEEEPYEHCQLSWGDRPERYSKVFGDVLQEKTNQAINALSQVELDGTPSFYIGVSDVCTHRMSELDIPVWCKDADSALTAMNFINNYQQPKTDPKLWTVADQQAGRDPKVGDRCFSDYDEQPARIIAKDVDDDFWFQCDNGYVRCTDRYKISPLEMPEEKAIRLENEFRDAIYAQTSSLFKTSDEIKAFNIGVRSAYRAMNKPNEQS